MLVSMLNHVSQVKEMSSLYFWFVNVMKKSFIRICLIVQLEYYISVINYLPRCSYHLLYLPCHALQWYHCLFSCIFISAEFHHDVINGLLLHWTDNISMPGPVLTQVYLTIFQSRRQKCICTNWTIFVPGTKIYALW